MKKFYIFLLVLLPFVVVSGQSAAPFKITSKPPADPVITPYTACKINTERI